MKVVWIIIAILVLVLIALLFFNKGNAQQTGTSGTAATAPDPILGALTNMISQPVGGLSSKTCRKDCDTLCGSLPDKLFGCGDRCTCKKNCESACIAGQPYKTMFP